MSLTTLKKWFVCPLLIVFLCIGCGGSGGSASSDGDDTITGKTSSTFVQELTDLEERHSDGEITDDQFVEEIYDVYDEIENTENGLTLLQAYLEENVMGYSMDESISYDSMFKASDIDGYIESIKNSSVYQFFSNFFTTVIFTQVPEPASIAIQATNPETFVSLSTGVGYVNLKRALIDNQIDIGTYQELHDINRTNPYEAQRQLLTTLGEPIPDWLDGAPDNCLTNCEGESGAYYGSFDGNANFSRVFSETTCTWNVRFVGDVDVTLQSASNSSVSGSTANAYGTTSWSYVSGTTPSFTCQVGSMGFDSTDDISGYTTNMSWSSDLGGGVFTGVFTGDLYGSSVSGNMSVSYSLGTGSLTIPLTLTKEE